MNISLKGVVLNMNKYFILGIVCLLLSFNAFAVTETTTWAAGTYGWGAATIDAGYKIYTKTPVTLLNVTTQNSGNCANAITRILLKNAAGSVLTTSSVTSNIATFNYNLTNATYYYITGDTSGGSYTCGFSGADASYHRAGTYINFTAGRDFNGVDDTNSYQHIKTIGVIENLPLAPAPINFTYTKTCIFSGLSLNLATMSGCY